MSSHEEIREFLNNLELCSVCILRYVDKLNFNRFQESVVELNNAKKKKSNICSVCLGIFQGLDLVADEIVNDSSLSSYDSKSLYTSISIPISLLIRDLAIWIALIQRFPGTVDQSKTK